MLDDAANRSGTGVAVFARQSGLIGSAATASSAASTDLPVLELLGPALALRSLPPLTPLRPQPRLSGIRGDQPSSSWISTWFIDPFRPVIILIKSYSR